MVDRNERAVKAANESYAMKEVYQGQVFHLGPDLGAHTSFVFTFIAADL